MKSVFMKDKHYVEHILKHYSELQIELSQINNDFDAFQNSTFYRKAILFDLLQIGELFNGLSDGTKNQFSKEDCRGIVDTRNYVAHGYIQLKDKSIWKTLYEELPPLVAKLEELFK